MSIKQYLDGNFNKECPHLSVSQFIVSNTNSYPLLNKMLCKYHKLNWLMSEENDKSQVSKNYRNKIKKQFPKEYAELQGPTRDFYKAYNEGCVSILELLRDHPENFYG